MSPPSQKEQRQHGYVNFTPAMVPGRMFYPPTTPSLQGSPLSTSTATTATGGAGSSMSSGSSSSGSSTGGGKYGHHTAVFYSPSRFNKYSGGGGTIHHVHPGLSPMMHHDFLHRSRQQQQQQQQHPKQQHHFTTAGRGGRGAHKRSGDSGSVVDLFV